MLALSPERAAIHEPRATPRATVGERAAFCALLLLYLALSLLVFNQIEEDAFIYFRLLGNLVHGDGLVFNRGGEPIEAGSSPLWMLLLLLCWKAPWDIVITAKLLGLAAGCGCLWLVWRIARVQIADPVLRLGPPLLTVGSTPFLMWSQRGLETPLFTLVVLWLALCCTDPRRFRWWAVPGVLLLPARPEGFIFLLGLLPVLGCDRARWRAARGSMLVVAVAAIVLLAARLVYFHDLAPSPFYTKLHGGSVEGLSRIREYVHHSWLFAFTFPLLLVGWQRRFWTRQRVTLAGFIAIGAAWSVLADDYMPYVRHLVPVIPLVNVLLVAAAGTLGARAGGWRRTLGVGYIVAMCVVTLFYSRSSGYFGQSGENAVRVALRTLVARPSSFAGALVTKLRSPATVTPLDQITGETDTLSNYQAQIGEFLRRNYPADASVVYDQMGQTPFYAGPTMRFIDSWGLTDRTIGRFYFERSTRSNVFLRLYDVVAARAVRLAFGEPRAEITEATARDYVFGMSPTVILIHDLAVWANPAGLPARLSQDPRLTERYERRYTLAGIVQVYERKDTPRKSSLDVPAGLSVVPR